MKKHPIREPLLFFLLYAGLRICIKNLNSLKSC
ncbi:hypothetical protein NEOC95_001064 [Neochlamydia sp. AcF95]|nr:hypothetical protein [Neochlamydia sp. AcF95]